ncbi:MAG: flippase [Nanoarchaeota archaeon]
MKEDNSLEIRESLKLIAKTSVIVFLSIVFSKIVGYIYRILIARYYGPEIYGVFLISLMVAGWFGAFFSLGLLEGVVRFISIFRGKKQFNKIKYLYNFSSLVLLTTGLLGGIVMFLTADTIAIKLFHNPELTIFIKLLGLIMPISLISNLFLSILRAFEKIYWYSFIFNIIQNLTKISLLVIFIILSVNSSAVILSHILAVIPTLILSYIICKKGIKFLFKNESKLRETKLMRKDLIYYSLPVMFHTILSSFFFWIDTFSIGLINGALEVGIYNAAVPIATLLVFVPEIFMQLFFPMISKKLSQGKINNVEELSKTVSKWILILNLPIFSIMFFFPGIIINTLFGSNYLAAADSLRILSIGMFFSSFFIVSNNLLSAAGKSKTILFDIVLAGLLNLVLNQVLIPVYGIKGAAYSTTLSLILLNLLFFYQSYKYTKVFQLRRKMLGIVLVACISAISLIIIRSFLLVNLYTLIFAGLVYGLVYMALIFLTRSLDSQDLFIIKTFSSSLFKKSNKIYQKISSNHRV